MSTLLLIFLCFVAILTGIFFTVSPGKPMPFLDESGIEIAGSLSEKRHVDINGVRMGMFIKGKNKSNPILLFLHGGPGMPEYFLAEKYPTGLEDYFTVCYWEQRYAGISYSNKISIETLTVEQYISDTIAVTKYLQERFGQEKIYLMAHSGGSFFGIQAVARAPELFKSYIGIAQISNQMQSEKMAYTYMIEQYSASGNKKMLNKLKKYSIFKSETSMKSYLNSLLRDDAMHELGIGTMRKMRSVKTGIFWPILNCRAYTTSEKVNVWRGKMVLRKCMWDKISKIDLTNVVTKIDIPVYFFSGAYDYTVSKKLTADYLERLQASVKGFYCFEESAHSPQFEEPEKFLSIMVEDVLNGKADQGDIEYENA